MSEKIVLGGGCFWCLDACYRLIDGVKSTTGYSGGSGDNPTYHQVCSGETGHAEVVLLEYDETKVPLGKLLDIMFKIHDPTTLNKQGNDSGTQYRSVIYYTTDKQKKEVEGYMKKVSSSYDKPIVTEVKKLVKFWPAEDYHQDYFRKNPLQPYCMFVVRPKVNKVEGMK